ncbi:hypothetical protein OKW41_004962 [Paraburkholderia sp. UCT70]
MVGGDEACRLKGMAEGPLKQLTQALEKVKAQIRARVEHPFHVVKNLFNHKKTRYQLIKEFRAAAQIVRDAEDANGELRVANRWSLAMPLRMTRGAVETLSTHQIPGQWTLNT